MLFLGVIENTRAQALIPKAMPTPSISGSDRLGPIRNTLLHFEMEGGGSIFQVSQCITMGPDLLLTLMLPLGWGIP